jgi:hypothetical protein
MDKLQEFTGVPPSTLKNEVLKEQAHYGIAHHLP